MTRRARAAVAAITLGLAGCGYYAPPIRPDAADAATAGDATAKDATAKDATAKDATAGRDDAMRPAEAAPEDSDD